MSPGLTETVTPSKLPECLLLLRNTISKRRHSHVISFSTSQASCTAWSVIPVVLERKSWTRDGKMSGAQLVGSSAGWARMMCHLSAEACVRKSSNWETERHLKSVQYSMPHWDTRVTDTPQIKVPQFLLYHIKDARSSLCQYHAPFYLFTWVIS